MKIKTILVPTDFSENAVTAGAYAMWLADNYQADVRFLHVVLPETGELDLPVISAKGTLDRVDAARGVLEAFDKAVNGKLRSMYQPRNKVEVTSEVIVGAPGGVIPEVISQGVDLCVMGTRGKHNRLDHLFGSITTIVLRKADIPVFVVPSNISHLSISKAAYATELSLADPILLWRATNFLKPFNSTIAVVHVQSDPDERCETSLEELREFPGRCLPLESTYHELKGEFVGDRLESFARREKVDLMVLHARKRSFIERMWSPSVSRQLALDSTVPLLIIQ